MSTDRRTITIYDEDILNLKLLSCKDSSIDPDNVLSKHTLFIEIPSKFKYQIFSVGMNPDLPNQSNVTIFKRNDSGIGFKLQTPLIALAFIVMSCSSNYRNDSVLKPDDIWTTVRLSNLDGEWCADLRLKQATFRSGDIITCQLKSLDHHYPNYQGDFLNNLTYQDGQKFGISDLHVYSSQEILLNGCPVVTVANCTISNQVLPDVKDADLKIDAEDLLTLTKYVDPIFPPKKPVINYLDAPGKWEVFYQDGTSPDVEFFGGFVEKVIFPMDPKCCQVHVRTTPMIVPIQIFSIPFGQFTKIGKSISMGDFLMVSKMENVTLTEIDPRLEDGIPFSPCRIVDLLKDYKIAQKQLFPDRKS